MFDDEKTKNDELIIILFIIIVFNNRRYFFFYEHEHFIVICLFVPIHIFMRVQFFSRFSFTVRRAAYTPRLRFDTIKIRSLVLCFRGENNSRTIWQLVEKSTFPNRAAFKNVCCNISILVAVMRERDKELCGCGLRMLLFICCGCLSPAPWSSNGCWLLMLLLCCVN